MRTFTLDLSASMKVSDIFVNFIFLVDEFGRHVDILLLTGLSVLLIFNLYCHTQCTLNLYIR